MVSSLRESSVVLVRFVTAACATLANNSFHVGTTYLLHDEVCLIVLKEDGSFVDTRFFFHTKAGGFCYSEVLK